MSYQKKYTHAPIFTLPSRRWPEAIIATSPRWCSVDLRDGNQALPIPMDIEQKIAMFEMLCRMGFKEIEVGFPSASQIEFDFIRRLIDEKKIPDDVTVQILVQAREHLIQRSFEALKGAKRIVIHLYNSTSEAQRRIVFQKTQEQIIALAVQGVQWVIDHARSFDGEVILQYSPESFTGTEPEFALEICNRVIETWHTYDQGEIIINLPSTVEMTTPNRFADRIEWMSDRLSHRDRVTLCVHTHNDRGTGVATAELAVLAGAQRVEGTILGNGERTGNLDILTMALNMMRDGIETGLDFRHSPEIVALIEQCTGIATHPRHPYVGELVYTAFSGSHQDAINKGMKAQKQASSSLWEVPYLPIDPADIGRSYDGIIQVNSQSGKGGVAYTLSQAGYHLPKCYHADIAHIIQAKSEEAKTIIPSTHIVSLFEDHFVNHQGVISLLDQESSSDHHGGTIAMRVHYHGCDHAIHATHPDGIVSAAAVALGKITGRDIAIVQFDEHMREVDSHVEAVCYITLQVDGHIVWGVGCNHDIVMASIGAMMTAINRLRD